MRPFPRPLPLPPSGALRGGKGCLLVGITLHRLVSIMAGMVWFPPRLPPVWGLGEGWGEVMN